MGIDELKLELKKEQDKIYMIKSRHRLEEFRKMIFQGDLRQEFEDDYNKVFNRLSPSQKEMIVQPTKEGILENLTQIKNVYQWEDSDYFWLNVIKGLGRKDLIGSNSYPEFSATYTGIGNILIFYNTIDEDSDVVGETKKSIKPIAIEEEEEWIRITEGILQLIYKVSNDIYKEYYNLESTKGTIVGRIEDNNVYILKGETTEDNLPIDKDKPKTVSSKVLSDILSGELTTTILLVTTGVLVGSPILIILAFILMFNDSLEEVIFPKPDEDRGVPEEDVKKLNTIYMLEDKTPVRLYEILYVDNKNLKLSADIYSLGKDDRYKELVVDKIGFNESNDLIKSFKKESENEQKVLKYEQDLKLLEEQNEKSLKAHDYVSEYHKSREKNKEQLGMYHSSEKWKDKKEEIKNDMERLKLENTKLKESLSESMSKVPKRLE